MVSWRPIPRLRVQRSARLFLQQSTLSLGCEGCGANRARTVGRFAPTRVANGLAENEHSCLPPLAGCNPLRREALLDFADVSPRIRAEVPQPCRQVVEREMTGFDRRGQLLPGQR